MGVEKVTARMGQGEAPPWGETWCPAWLENPPACFQIIHIYIYDVVFVAHVWGDMCVCV